MIKFRDIDHASSWLTKQSRDLVIVLALRSALRAIPLVPGQARSGFQPTKSQVEDSILLTFRAFSCAWAWANFSESRQHLLVPVQQSSDVLRAVTSANFSICEIAMSVALSISTKSSARAAFEAKSALQKSILVLSSTSSRVAALTAFEVDAFRVESGQSVETVLGYPLWPDGDLPAGLEGRWRRLESDLLSQRKNWEFWVDWYLRRLYGKSESEPLEILPATLSEEVWGRGVLALNSHASLLAAEIRHKADEVPNIELIPEQVHQALMFGGDEADAIRLLDDPGEALLDTRDQRESYDDIKDRAISLRSLCGNSNRLVDIGRLSSKLAESMGDSFEKLRVRSFWAQMNSLRHRLEAGIQLQNIKDPDSPPLPEEILAHLHDLVDVMNVFSAHEPKLSVLDELKRDPESRYLDEGVVKAVHAVSDMALNEPQVVSPDAARTLEQIVVEYKNDDESISALRAKQFSFRSARNLVLEIIRRSYKMILGETNIALGETKKSLYKAGSLAAAVYLFKSYEMIFRALVDTLGGNATLHKIVDLIVQAAAKF